MVDPDIGYHSEAVHHLDKIDRLTALLAERDAEIEKLKLIEVVYRAIINNTHIAEDERLAKIIELTEQLAVSQQEQKTASHNARFYSDKCCELEQEVDKLKNTPTLTAREHSKIWDDARKQAAGEIVEFLSDLGLVSDASAIKAIRTRFGLEG